MSGLRVAFGVEDVMALRSQVLARSTALRDVRAASEADRGFVPTQSPGVGFADTLHNALKQVSAVQDRSSQKLASIALFSQLRETASRGASFKTMLDPLLELNKANPKTNALLLQLLPVATTGLHSAEELQKQFTTTLDATLQRDKGSSFAHNLAKLIRIRKIGEQTGNDDESILARTEKAVAAQDLPAAIKHLDTLSTEAKKLMAPWVRAAQEHLNAQSTLTALQLSLASDETPAREAKEEPVSEIAAEAKIEAPKTETPATETDPLPAPEAVIPDSKPDKPEEDKVAE